MRSLGETKLTNQSELLGQKEIDIFSLPSRRPLRPRKVALFWRPERVLVTTPHQTSSSKINMLSRRDLLATFSVTHRHMREDICVPYKRAPLNI